MHRFFSPLLIMMSVVVMVAALADRSASADFKGTASQITSEQVTICHPLISRDGEGVDVVAYEVAARDAEMIEEHRSHGDVILSEPSTNDDHACPGNVIHMDRL